MEIIFKNYSKLMVSVSMAMVTLLLPLLIFGAAPAYADEPTDVFISDLNFAQRTQDSNVCNVSRVTCDIIFSSTII